MRPLIADIKRGTSVSALIRSYASGYPSNTVRALEELTPALLAFGSGKLSDRPVEAEYFSSQSSFTAIHNDPSKKTFRKKLKTFRSCLTSVIILWLVGGLLMSGYMSSKDKGYMGNFFDPDRTPTEAATTTSSGFVNDLPGIVSGTTGVVIPIEGLNLRKEPDINGEWITTMSQSTAVTVIKTENGWAYVDYNGIYGWCSMEYLEIKD